ncbi:MAG: hypothetical protein ACYC5Y_02515 [Symbiobacteriia bacterium]
MHSPGLFTWWGSLAGLGVLALPLLLPRGIPATWLLWAVGIAFGLAFHWRVSRDWPRLVVRVSRSWTGAVYADVVQPESGQSYSQRLATWALAAVLLWLTPFFWVLWRYEGAPPDLLYRAVLLGGLSFPGAVFASAGYWGSRTYREKVDRGPGPAR